MGLFLRFSSLNFCACLLACLVIFECTMNILYEKMLRLQTMLSSSRGSYPFLSWSGDWVLIILRWSETELTLGWVAVLASFWETFPLLGSISPGIPAVDLGDWTGILPFSRSWIFYLRGHHCEIAQSCCYFLKLSICLLSLLPRQLQKVADVFLVVLNSVHLGRQSRYFETCKDRNLASLESLGRLHGAIFQ